MKIQMAQDNCRVLRAEKFEVFHEQHVTVLVNIENVQTSPGSGLDVFSQCSSLLSRVEQWILDGFRIANCKVKDILHFASKPKSAIQMNTFGCAWDVRSSDHSKLNLANKEVKVALIFSISLLVFLFA